MFERGGKISNRSLDVSFSLPDVGPIIQRFGEMWFDFDGLGVISQSAFNISCGQASVRPIVIRESRTRADFKCPVKIFYGCGEISFVVPGYSAIAICIGQARIEDQGQIEITDRAIPVAMIQP